MRVLAATALVLSISAGCTQADVFDLVVLDGRVLDPETGLDGVRHIGVSDGMIGTVTERSIQGHDTIHAAGLAVAPGFIDLNTYQHGDPLFRLRAADGVTTVLNLEDGAADASSYYAALEGRALLNYGAAVDHESVRYMAAGDSTISIVDGVNETRGQPSIDQRPLNAQELQRLDSLARAQLDAGAVAIGFGLYYTPGATHSEVLRLSRLADEYGVPVHIHARAFDPTRDWGELYEPIALAVATGASVHIKHLQSTFGSFTVEALEMLERAVGFGLGVSTECYPYAAGLTFIQSAPFDGFAEWTDAEFNRFEWPPTGERLTRESFARYRTEGGVVVIHPEDPEAQERAVRDCLVHPLTVVASDGAWDGGATHPRVAGTNARVLGRYVREEGLLTLMEAVSKMTVQPARLLESAVPEMRAKGRVQVGADADLVIFDPDRVLDRATYREPLLPSVGIDRVLVAGVTVVHQGEVVSGAFPGKAVRTSARPSPVRGGG